jgi:fructose-bisphosphate aldolase class I
MPSTTPQDPAHGTQSHFLFDLCRSLTFSYGRALQQSCLKAWKGADENIPEAQAVLYARARANGQANLGQYTGGAGGEGANQSTFVKGYVY